MVKKLFDSILGKSPVKNEDEYMELDLASYEGSSTEEPAAMYIKIATIADLKDTPRVKDEVYNGNIVIVDIGRLKMDKVTFERVLKDLRDVAKDVNGDIVGLGEQKYVVITPMSVKVSREKIGGGV
ncbi:MAG: cell division protein SepF [Methanoculleus sp.]|uniref:cell division protein SepF n=1 Tax=unclassified Methanoculleus TaxID=2619537 RepID=UPI0025D97240|nr:MULTISPECIES: cell division protein SepF [unclassified Methanoculleus]MCK9317411.1 cell division protein SepF [Methanoculleus sp.]MDD2253481.1 cell division protein SepF [Methanoculleus sp.]MDD3215403.1 cell division protein SepF [Methanoculleus sp.]MDD4314249.1 cell division protein SepF [Methanoculleus sp.]MDD4470005.1 cell division protein SepF [Methanoculleus sp.]